jgi:hypothetical protein
MTDARVRELADLVVQSAGELSSLWPLRLRTGARAAARDVAAAARL